MGPIPPLIFSIKFSIFHCIFWCMFNAAQIFPLIFSYSDFSQILCSNFTAQCLPEPFLFSFTEWQSLATTPSTNAPYAWAPWTSLTPGPGDVTWKNTSPAWTFSQQRHVFSTCSTSTSLPVGKTQLPEMDRCQLVGQPVWEQIAVTTRTLRSREMMMNPWMWKSKILVLRLRFML